MKKVTISFFVLVLTFLCIIGGCASKDLTEGKSAKDIILASTEAMQNIKSYSFNMETAMSIPNPMINKLEDMTMTGSGSINMEPLKAHMDINVDVQSQKMNTEMYIVTEEDKIVEYFSNPFVPQEWAKIELPLNDQMNDMINPAKSLELLDEMLVDASIAGEETIDDKGMTILEVTVKPEALSKLMQMPTNSSAIPIDEVEEILKTMGDMKYKAWVQKDNLMMTKMEINFSDMLKNLLTSQPEMQFKDETMLNELNATMTMNFNDFDKNNEIIIPESIFENAKLFDAMNPTMPNN